MNKDFEKGIEFVILEQDIKNLYQSISSDDLIKNDKFLLENLRKKVSSKFQDYLKIGFEYHVDVRKFKEMEKYYCLSMGLEWPREMKPDPEIGF